MKSSPARVNPFPGLRPFTQEEDYLFFGREEQTLELLQRLGGNRLVAVVGTSGSGKSSLVRCGLLSELLGGRMLDAGAAWEIAVTHPGGNPLALLTEALLEADLYDREEEDSRENLLATLSRSHFGLVEAVKQADLGAGTNFLLVVDQFEEIFRFHEAGQRQQEMANEFVSLLLEAAAQKEAPIYVVLTMRSDFIGECGQFEGLAEMVNRGEFLIPRLTRDQYKRVIEGPIKVAGGQIAPRLLQRLLNDLGQQADQLPCLQHALMRTWNVWAGNGGTESLDLDDYQRVGKMSQALSLHADEIFESLSSDRQRRLCRGMFQALTVEESNSRGIRRPQRLGRLSEILEVPAGELRPIIDAYRQSGVTFLMPSPEVELTDQTIIDISHESLMRVWGRLRQWVEEETQAAGIYHRLSESADLREQGKAGLYRDPELGIALAWREAQRPNAAWAERYRPGFAAAMAFLEASQQASIAEEQAQETARQRELEQAQRLAEAQQLRLEQQQHAARKLRKMIGGLAVVAIVAVCACVAALVANRRANELAILAQQKTEIAEASAADADRERTKAEQALAQVEAQKAAVQGSLTKAKEAERRSREFRYSTDMQLAAMLADDERANSQQLLNRLADHEPAKNGPTGETDDLRGFEWHYLKRLAEGGAAILAGFDTPVISAAVTSVGEVITLDREGRLRRWNATTREEIGTGRDLRQGRPLGAASLSRDGELAAVAIGDKVHVIAVATGAETAPALAATTQSGLTFTPDNRMVVTVGTGIGWWDANTGKVVAQKDFKLAVGGPLAISADGLTVAVGGQGSYRSGFSVFKLNPQAREITQRVDKVGATSTKRALAVSPDGETVAISYYFDGRIDLYSTATGKPLLTHPTAHSAAITAIEFHPDGKGLITASMDGSIKVWADFTQLLTTKVTRLMGHTVQVDGIAIAADGKEMASVGQDKTVRLWNLEHGSSSLQQTVAASSGRARFSPDGLLMAISGESRLRDGFTGAVVSAWPARIDGLSSDSVAFSADNRVLALGFGGGQNVSFVELRDIDRGERLAEMPAASSIPDFATTPYSGIVSGLAFSPDGRFLVASFGSLNLLGGSQGNYPLLVYDVHTRQVIRRLAGHRHSCISVAFSPDGLRMASASYDGTARIWDTATWQTRHVLTNPDAASDRGHQRVHDVAFSPDGGLLAMASAENNIILWDVATGQQVQTLRGHANEVWGVNFSPDGRTLASGSIDDTIRLWNTSTWRELIRLDPGANFDPRCLTFSPDGGRLLSAGQPTLLWSVPTDADDTRVLAKQLTALLQSKCDFPNRIRMVSDNVRLQAALEQVDSRDSRVAAAMAAAQADWHASRQAWPESVAAFDRLRAADPAPPEKWLRMPGLLRLATALLHQDRPRDAAALLAGGARRRLVDGLPAVVNQAGLGFTMTVDGGAVLVSKLLPGSPGSQSALRPGDVILKVNDTELTGDSLSQLSALLAGEAGTQVRLTVRHVGSEQPELVELTRERFLNDAATGDVLNPLRRAINDRLAQEPRHPELLELRAELAGQWSDGNAQLADYTAAIEALAGRTTDTAAADLRRLYGRRGNAHIALRQWQLAVDDYARCVTEATTDETLLANEAQAQAGMLLDAATATSTPLTPVEMKSTKGSTLALQDDGSILAGGTNPKNDTYVISALAPPGQLTALLLDAIPDPSQPGGGVGRGGGGSVALSNVTLALVTAPGAAPIPIPFSEAGSDSGLPANATNAIDDKPDTSWVVYPDYHLPHQLVLKLREPLAIPKGARLVIGLEFLDKLYSNHGLGRFRLSVSDDPMFFDREPKRFAAMRLTDPWARLAAAYRLQDDQPAINQLVERRPKAAAAIGDVLIQGEDKDWSRAVEIYSGGIAAETSDIELLSKRARAYESLRVWDAAAADWTRAATGNPDGARLLAEFARRLAADHQVVLAKGVFEKSQALYEQTLKVDADNDIARAELAQVVLDRFAPAEPNWVTLKPAGATAESGRALAEQDDGSILVEAAPEVVRWQAAPAAVQAIRIETSSRTTPRADGVLDFSEHQVIAATMAGAEAGALRGQFVRLDLPGNNGQFPRHPGDGDKKYINLAEVQVYCGETNVALRKKARQSSGDGQARSAAGGAVDGNTVGNDAGNPYAHTWDVENPWWEVDLGSEQAIDRVVVWNRSDVGLYARMNHFRIRVLDAARRVVFERVVDQAPAPSTEIVRPVLLWDGNAAAIAANEPLVLRLPQMAGNDVPHRYRVSVAASLVDLGFEDQRLELMKIADATTRLAAAYAVIGRNEDALLHFDRALAQANGYEARKPIFEVAAQYDAVLSALARRRPDDSQLQLAVARALAARGKTLLAEKRPADALTGLKRAHDLFAGLLPAVEHWTVLNPVEMLTENGSKLELQNDGSIFVDHPATKETYSLVFRSELKGIKGLRLEALTDSRLPMGGPGWTTNNGNFVLSELSLQSAPVQSPDQLRPVALRNASADFSQAGWSIDAAVDGIVGTGWAVSPEIGKDHMAIFETSETVGDGRPIRLTVRISNSTTNDRNLLGRFRVSFTTDATTLQAARIRSDLKQSEVADLNATLAVAYYVLGDRPALEELLKAAPDAAAGIGDLYAADESWEQAVATYSKAINPESNDTTLLTKRAEAYEMLEQWDLAVADWGRAGGGDPNLAFQRFKRVGADSWNWSFIAQGGAAGSINVFDGALELHATAATGSDWHLESCQTQLQLESGGEYVIRCKMKSPDACSVRLIATVDQDDWHNIGLSEAIDPPLEFQDYEFTLVPHDAVPGHSRIGFLFGASRGKVFVKDFVLLKKFEGVDYYTRRGTVYAQQGNIDEAVSAFARALRGTTSRAARTKVISATLSLPGVLEKLTEAAATDGLLQAELARRYAEHGDTELADAARSRARALLQDQLLKAPKNSGLAAELADLLLQPVGSRAILPTSELEGVAWLSTTTQPPDDWMNEGFDASTWRTAPGGFGAADSPGFVRRTDWSTSDIWLRQVFEWQPVTTRHALVLRLIHDDDVEVYFNGRKVARLPGWTPAYVMHPLDSAAEGALRAGVNTIAVHCHQNSGGQTIDVGIAEMPYDPVSLQQRFAALEIADPWAKLAAAYLILNDQPALDALLTAHPAAAAGIGDLNAAIKNWEGAIAAYGKLIKPETTDVALLGKRAEAYMASEQWELAKADWLRVIAQQPDQTQRVCDEFKKVSRWKEAAEFGLKLVQQKPEDSLEWLRIAPILILAEDQTAYADFCGRMAEQFGDSQFAEDAERVVKGSLLRTGLIDLSKLPAGRFTSSLDNGTVPDWFPPWGWGTRALLAQRSGDADSVLKYAAKSEEFNPAEVSHAFNLALVAAAQHQLQHPDEARKALEEALLVITRLKEDPGQRINHDLLIAEILFREAEAKINGSGEPSKMP